MKELVIDSELWQEALDFFGSKEKTLKWLRQALLSLDEVSPKESYSGHYSHNEAVSRILQQLKEKAAEYQEKGWKQLNNDGWLIGPALWLDAVDYFGSVEKAADWFNKPLIALREESPGEYCTNHINGSNTVEELLNKLKHGMTA